MIPIILDWIYAFVVGGFVGTMLGYYPRDWRWYVAVISLLVAERVMRAGFEAIL